MYQLVICFRTTGFTVRQLPSAYDEEHGSPMHKKLETVAYEHFAKVTELYECMFVALYDPHGELIARWSNPKDRD